MARKNAQVDTHSRGESSPNGQGRPQEQEDQPLTENQMQQILQAGEQASQLLGNPVYNLVYQQLLNQKFSEWLSTDVKEERKRESLYFQARGLEEITLQAGALVEDARRLLQQQQQQADPNVARNQYLDRQGYGLN